MIIPILNTALNICRGGRYFPAHWAFSKWAITLYQMLLFLAGMLYYGKEPLWALIYILPHVSELLIGTGEQMQAGNTKPFPIDTDKQLNQFLCFVLDIEPASATDADKRRLGVWYCGVIGVLFAIPFIFLKTWVAPLVLFAHICLLSIYRYIPPITWNGQGDLRWRIFKEGLFFGLYSTLFWYCV